MKINKKEMLLHSVSSLISRHADANIRRLLLRSHPSEIASVIRQLANEEGIYVIQQLRNTEKERDVFVELEGKFLASYLASTQDDEHIAKVMQNVADDEVAGLLAELDDEHAQNLLSLMKSSKQEEVNEILKYGEDTCGRIMAVNVFALKQDLTAREAISKIQNSSDHLESIFYIYLVDEFEHLVGVVSMRQILQVQPDRVLKDFMVRDLISVNVYDTQEKAANYVEEYNFVSLPVVDDQGVLVGMITVDDVIDYIYDEAQDDVLQIAGVESEAIDDYSFWRAFFSRMTWYALLLFGGIFCSEIILNYFYYFPKEVFYLCFAPIVLRLGGSVATQSMTFVHQSLLNNDIERSRASQALWGQTLTTLIVALLLSVAVAFYATLRFSNEQAVALGLGLGIFVVAVTAIVVGAVVSLVSDKLKLDSMKASSRFIHFMMDALSLLVFFQFVWLWQTRLASVAIYWAK